MRINQFLSIPSYAFLAVFLAFFALSCQNGHNSNNSNNNNHHDTKPEALYKMSFPGATGIFVSGSGGSGVQALKDSSGSSKLEYTSADGQVKSVQFFGQDGKALNITQDAEMAVVNIGPDYLALSLFRSASADFEPPYGGTYLVNKKTGLCYKTNIDPGDIYNWEQSPYGQYFQFGNYMVLDEDVYGYNLYNFSNPQAVQESPLNLGKAVQGVFPVGMGPVNGQNHAFMDYTDSQGGELMDLSTGSTKLLSYYFSPKKGSPSSDSYECQFYTDAFGHVLVYIQSGGQSSNNYQFFQFKQGANTLPEGVSSSTKIEGAGCYDFYPYLTYKNGDKSVIVIPDATTVFTTTANTSVAPTQLLINGLAIGHGINCQTVFLSGDTIYALLSNDRLYYAEKSDPTQFSPVNVDPNHYTIYAITSNGDGTVSFSGADKNSFNAQVVGKLNTSGIMGKPTETPNAVKILVPMN